jgi:hypothetical protein
VIALRPIRPNRQGVILLPPEHRYRMLFAVEGIMRPGELERALERTGFHELGVTWENDWDALRPSDWPDEPEARAPYPVGLVRASGVLWPVYKCQAVKFEPEHELAAGSFTLLRAWDLGRVVAEPEEGQDLEDREIVEVGQDADPPSAAPMSTGVKVAIASAAALAVWTIWQHGKEDKDIDRAAARYAALASKADAARTRQRAAELVAEGMCAKDAGAVAELESVEREEAAEIVAAAAAEGVH